MVRSNEEIKVGVVVAVGIALLLTAWVFVGGLNLFRERKVEYTTYFKFAGGLDPGSLVRFGGLKVGAVATAEIDRKDTTRIRVDLKVKHGTPIRTDSQARISSLGFLGENYLEISAGTRDAPLLPPGSVIPSAEIVQIADVMNNANNVTVSANKLVTDLDARVLALSDNISELVKNLDDVVSPENREHFHSLLANADEMLKDDRPKLDRTLSNMEVVTAKLSPTLDNINVTIAKTDMLVEHLDGMLLENRAAIHQTLLRLQTTLADAQRLTGDLDDALEGNRENIDEILENLRATSNNLRQFSDTLKQRPFSLIRIKTEKDRVPPTGK